MGLTEKNDGCQWLVSRWLSNQRLYMTFAIGEAEIMLNEVIYNTWNGH